MAPAVSVPVIDFARYGSDDAVPRALDKACREHGFVALRNPGVSSATVAAAFAAAKTLFALPDATKRATLKPIDLGNQGYSAFESEKLNRRRGADRKEAFNVKFARNDYRGCPPGFEAAAEALVAELRSAVVRYAEACAVALELPKDHFSKHFQDFDLCTVRFLHYPPLEEDVADRVFLSEDSTSAVRAAEHTDFGLMTFLFVDGDDVARGLQAKPEGADSWVDVDATPGDGCVVNTGALAARWTNDVWRATLHRVVVPDVDAASGHRYSIACFFDPDAAALVQVHDKFLGGGEAPRYPPITAEAYVLQKLRELKVDPAAAEEDESSKATPSVDTGG